MKGTAARFESFHILLLAFIYVYLTRDHIFGAVLYIPTYIRSNYYRAYTGPVPYLKFETLFGSFGSHPKKAHVNDIKP